MLKPDSRVLCGFLIVLFLSATAGYSFDGGGKAEISPYSSKETITAERVSKQKDLARASMTATYEFNGAKETLNAVGLEWIRGGQVSGRTSYQLNGSMDSRPVAVDFSEIEELSILRTETNGSKVRALFKVVAFPSISAERLVNERPTYTELKAKYSRTVEVWIDIKTTTSGELCFAGKQSAPRRVEDLKSDVVVKFAFAGLSLDDKHPGLWKGVGEGIWWAIPSVIRDPKYPYRRPVMVA